VVTVYAYGANKLHCVPLLLLFVAPETFLLFSRRSSITRILVDTVEDAPDVRLPVDGLRSVRALDFDPVDMVAYWIENQSNTIRRAHDTAVHVCATLRRRFVGSI